VDVWSCRSISAGEGADAADSVTDDRLALPELVEEDTDDLYDNAPCGYLSTLLDGTITKVNATLLDWLGYTRTDLIGRRWFLDLLTPGGQILHETHCVPLLRMQGEIRGVTLDLRAADGSRLPVLITSMVKPGSARRPTLIRTDLGGRP
jgi:phosphoserine phosphatase RsbU/P